MKVQAILLIALGLAAVNAAPTPQPEIQQRIPPWYPLTQEAANKQGFGSIVKALMNIIPGVIGGKEVKQQQYYPWFPLTQEANQQQYYPWFPLNQEAANKQGIGSALAKALLKVGKKVGPSILGSVLPGLIGGDDDDAQLQGIFNKAKKLGRKVIKGGSNLGTDIGNAIGGGNEANEQLLGSLVRIGTKVLPHVLPSIIGAIGGGKEDQAVVAQHLVKDQGFLSSLGKLSIKVLPNVINALTGGKKEALSQRLAQDQGLGDVIRTIGSVLGAPSGLLGGMIGGEQDAAVQAVVAQRLAQDQGFLDVVRKVGGVVGGLLG